MYPRYFPYSKRSLQAFSGPVPETLGNLVELTALELHGPSADFGRGSQNKGYLM